MSGYRKRLNLKLTLLFLLGGFCIALATPRPAQADPHAIFYTAVGQRQLFFNVLSALDQADYVEPADGFDFSRATTLERRSQVPFEIEVPVLDENGKPVEDEAGNPVTEKQTVYFDPEQNPAVASTKTDLSSVLTRNITLEGHDLWTAYLAHQFAIEAARRNGLNAVISVYCERGLGLKECGNKAKNVGAEEAVQLRREAFVVNNTARSNNAYYLGSAITDSSYSPTSRYRELLEDLDAGETPHDRNLSNFPVPFDPAIASLRQNRGGGIHESAAVERIAQAGRNLYRPTQVTEDAFADIQFDSESGDVKLPSKQHEGEPEGARSYIDRYTSKLLQLLDLPSAAMATAARGTNIAKSNLLITEEQGAVADVSTWPIINQGAVLGRVSNVSVPAHAKVSSTDSALNALGQAEQNLKYVPTEAESIPGGQELVEHRSPGNTVRGISTASEQALGVQEEGTGSPNREAGGRVLHATDTTPRDHHELKDPLPPNTNPKYVHDELFGTDLFAAIGFKKDEGGCPCNTNKLLNSYGSSILALISRL
jgi:hypothetical protein